MYAPIEEVVAELKVVETEIFSWYERDENHELTHPIAVEEREAYCTKYKEKYPRRKFNFNKAQDAFPDMVPEWAARKEAYAIPWNNRRIAAEKKLAELCANPELPVPTAEEYILLYQVSGSDYRSMGYGCDKYAKMRANWMLLHAQTLGLEAELRVMEVHEGVTASFGSWGGYSYKYTDYGVFAKTTELGKTIWVNKPELPTRDRVKYCLQHGVNPRVYDPHLSPGYEERVGLDHFGNEVPPQPNYV